MTFQNVVHHPVVVLDINDGVAAEGLRACESRKSQKVQKENTTCQNNSDPDFELILALSSAFAPAYFLLTSSKKMIGQNAILS